VNRKVKNCINVTFLSIYNRVPIDELVTKELVVVVGTSVWGWIIMESLCMIQGFKLQIFGSNWRG